MYHHYFPTPILKMNFKVTELIGILYTVGTLSMGKLHVTKYISVSLFFREIPLKEII